MGSRFAHRISLTVVVGVMTVAAAAACAGSPAKIVEADAESQQTSAKVSVTPESDAKDVPVSSEIKVSVKKGKMSGFSVVNGDGDKVPGEMRPDDSSWVPDKPLKYDSQYAIKGKVTDDEGISDNIESKFSTMPEPSNQINGSLWNGDGKTFGKAMPIMVDFPRDIEIPEDKRESVEKRLFVSSEPKQPGAWHWFSGNHLEYRPEGYWEPGTKINVRLGLQGLPLGDGMHGASDVSGDVTISDTDREVHVSDDKKNLIAYENGGEVKKMDVSLGKKGNESYSGTMTIMEKLKKTTFDTTDEPGCNGKEDGKDCYKTKIKYAQRLTWSGQFIHSAPWSVGDQGSRNVSHGCVNISEKNAKWIFDFAQIGDPVKVEGTGHDLPAGDGFTAYNLSWEEFLKGSYLPPPETPKD